MGRITCMILSCTLLVLTSVSNVNAADGSDKIRWNPWQQSAFKQAKAENKLILINVGLEGCTACNRMAKDTYSDPNVIKLLNDHFISIEVDSQARPDIGERYSDWAWPATVFLLPDATQIFAMAGNRFPENFIPILNDLITKQKRNTLKPDPNSPYSLPEKPLTTPFTQLRDRLSVTIDDQFNRQVGGWNGWGVNAEVDGSRLEHLYFRAHRLNDKNLLDDALKVSDTFFKTLDPVWGGAYEANIDKSATNVPDEFSKLRAIPEKRISSQANALSAFATAYQLTQDSKYIKGIENVNRYLDEWMQSQEGTWYANQKDIPPLLPKNWWAQDYWALTSDSARRKYGVPPIDHAVYSDKNAEIILAYLNVYQAVKDKRYLDKAEKAANAIINQRMTSEGWVLQSVADEALKQDQRIRALATDTDKVPFLITQARFGQAATKLYQLTADKKWLTIAMNIADAMLVKLYDQKHGGFWATPMNESEQTIKPRKPLENNAVAGQFFYDLYVLTKSNRYKDIATDTLRAVVSDNILAREGKVVAETALLLEKLTAQYVEFTVVTKDAENQKAKQLYEIGLNTYHPRKIIHFEKPGRYPDLGKAVMFICNPNRCSRPLSSQKSITKTVEQYR
ncbi:MAG: thioredoxin domain-containing protein [Shewanella sp.]|nr:thioredoxin domain-containing protein [Shewanella sp.]